MFGRRRPPTLTIEMTDLAPWIDPDQAPGGLVLRITRGNAVVWWEALHPDRDESPRATGHRHAQILRENAPCTAHLFDGDTGQCVAICSATREHLWTRWR